MKITCLETANFKRIKALRLEPKDKGLTIIGGGNGQGKTSVLDALAFLLGGAKFKPTNMKREGSVGDMVLRVETDNGLVIERKGKNASLTVTDSTGQRQGQGLLDALVSEIAINLPKFHEAKPKDKASMLLQVLGIEDTLVKFDKEIKSLYDRRTIVGQEQTRKEKHAEEMPYYEDAPAEAVSVKDLVKQQQEILARNGIKEEHRRKFEANNSELERVNAELKRLAERRDALVAEIKSAESEDFTLESTGELEKQIADFEEINRKVRANADREAVKSEAAILADNYTSLTKEIEDKRAERAALLEGAQLPLPGLTVEEGELRYNGKAWDCMSGSEQLLIDCAIASRLNPDCKFVLLDKGEQFDLESLSEVDKWFEEHDLQGLITRISTNRDGECTIVIEDGEATTPAGTVVVPKTAPKTPAPKPSAENAISDDDL